MELRVSIVTCVTVRKTPQYLEACPKCLLVCSYLYKWVGKAVSCRLVLAQRRKMG